MMRKLAQCLYGLYVVLLCLGLSGCFGTSPSFDAKVTEIIGYVRGKCGFLVDAASIAAMLAAPNPATAPTVKTIGTAICVALNEDAVDTSVGLLWQAEPAACPMVNGVCIKAEPDDGKDE